MSNNWYKHEANGEWLFEIRFQHELAKDQHIHKWIQHEKDLPHYRHLNIHTKDANYHKTQQRKIQQQAMRQLYQKIISIINDTPTPATLNQTLVNENTKLIPDYILKTTCSMTLPEEMMDFMHLYNIPPKTQSTQTTKKAGET